MIVSISQPTLFPWLGYFNIIKNSDIFVFLDIVKFEKRSWQMRNKVKLVTPEEEKEIWIKIPTKMENTETLIKDVLIDNSQKGKKQHLNILRSSYGKKSEQISFIFNLYEREWEKIVDFNIQFISECCKFLNIKTQLVRASDYNFVGKKSQLIFDICKKLSATEYLTTIGSKDYLEKDREFFGEKGIEITYQEYKHPIYKQKGKSFIENLSIVDLLFNEYLESSKFFNNISNLKIKE